MLDARSWMLNGGCDIFALPRQETCLGCPIRFILTAEREDCISTNQIAHYPALN
jgi:hypothetical protein